MMEYLITYVVILLSYLSYIIIYKQFQNKKFEIRPKKTIIIFLIISILMTMSSMSDLALLNFFFNIATLVLIIIYGYNERFKKALYYSIIIFLITLFSDAITSIFIRESLLSNHAEFLKYKIFRSFLTIPVLIGSYFITKIPLVKVSVNNFFEKYISKKSLNEKIITIIVITINFLVILFCIYAYNNVNKLGHVILIIAICMIIILIIMFLRIIYNEYQVEQVNKKIIEENKYIINIAKKDEEFKHNVINNLLGIKTVGNKKTNLLIDEIISNYQTEYKTITNVNDLPIGIQSIVYRKIYTQNITELNLVVNNLIKSEIYDILTPKDYNHMCTCIGILFDNALEAVNSYNKKVIEIEFSEDNNYINIIIKNLFSDFIDMDELGQRNYTTKFNGHGIGLDYIKRIKSFQFKSEIVGDVFIAKLKIEKKKRNY